MGNLCSSSNIQKYEKCIQNTSTSKIKRSKIKTNIEKRGSIGHSNSHKDKRFDNRLSIRKLNSRGPLLKFRRFKTRVDSLLYYNIVDANANAFNAEDIERSNNILNNYGSVESVKLCPIKVSDWLDGNIDYINSMPPDINEPTAAELSGMLKELPMEFDEKEAEKVYLFANVRPSDNDIFIEPQVGVILSDTNKSSSLEEKKLVNPRITKNVASGDVKCNFCDKVTAVSFTCSRCAKVDLHKNCIKCGRKSLLTLCQCDQNGWRLTCTNCGKAGVAVDSRCSYCGQLEAITRLCSYCNAGDLACIYCKKLQSSRDKEEIEIVCEKCKQSNTVSIQSCRQCTNNLKVCTSCSWKEICSFCPLNYKNVKTAVPHTLDSFVSQSDKQLIFKASEAAPVTQIREVVDNEVPPNIIQRFYPANFSFYTYFFPSETDEALLPFRRHILADVGRLLIEKKARSSFKTLHKDAFMDRRIRSIETQTGCRIFITILLNTKIVKGLPRRKVIIFGPSYPKIVMAMSIMEIVLPKLMENAIFHQPFPNITSRWATTNSMIVRKFKNPTSLQCKSKSVSGGLNSWKARILPQRFVPPVAPNRWPYYLSNVPEKRIIISKPSNVNRNKNCWRENQRCASDFGQEDQYKHAQICCNNVEKDCEFSKKQKLNMNVQNKKIKHSNDSSAIVKNSRCKCYFNCTETLPDVRNIKLDDKQVNIIDVTSQFTNIHNVYEKDSLTSKTYNTRCSQKPCKWSKLQNQRCTKSSLKNESSVYELQCAKCQNCFDFDTSKYNLTSTQPEDSLLRNYTKLFSMQSDNKQDDVFPHALKKKYAFMRNLKIPIFPEFHDLLKHDHHGQPTNKTFANIQTETNCKVLKVRLLKENKSEKLYFKVNVIYNNAIDLQRFCYRMGLQFKHLNFNKA